MWVAIPGDCFKTPNHSSQDANQNRNQILADVDLSSDVGNVCWVGPFDVGEGVDPRTSASYVIVYDVTWRPRDVFGPPVAARLVQRYVTRSEWARSPDRHFGRSCGSKFRDSGSE